MQFFTLSFNPKQVKIRWLESDAISGIALTPCEASDIYIEGIPSNSVATVDKISPAPTRKTRKPSQYGKYIYEAKGKYCVRVWDAEAHNYGTVDTLEEAVAVRDLAVKNHHPHLLEKLY